MQHQGQARRPWEGDTSPNTGPWQARSQSRPAASPLCWFAAVAMVWAPLKEENMGGQSW